MNASDTQAAMMIFVSPKGLESLGMGTAGVALIILSSMRERGVRVCSGSALGAGDAFGPMCSVGRAVLNPLVGVLVSTSGCRRRELELLVSIGGSDDALLSTALDSELLFTIGKRGGPMDNFHTPFGLARHAEHMHVYVGLFSATHTQLPH